MIRFMFLMFLCQTQGRVCIKARDKKLSNYSQTDLLLEYCCKKNATGCVAHGINTTLLRG